VKDVLPAGLQFISSTDFTLSTGNTLTSNNIPSVTSGGEVVLAFLAKPLITNPITNQAEVSKSDQFDSDSSPNNGVTNNEDDTDGITIGGQQADLSLKKDVDNVSPNVGDIVTYTITVNNAGPSTGTGFTFRFTVCKFSGFY
jgi:large repetitive protein